MKILLTTLILLIYLIIGILIVNLICATMLKRESIEKDEEIFLGAFVVLWPSLFFILIIYFIGKFTRNIVYKIRRKKKC